MRYQFEYKVEGFDSIKADIERGVSSDTLPVRGNISLEILRDGDFVYADLRDYFRDDDTFVAGWVYSFVEFMSLTEEDFNRVVTYMYNTEVQNNR
jgi:hypothetical protein